ncbi:MAG: hypothetical protein JSV33_01170 [bacterium]|nr:MAG: hypothetical protein JSV33_01170 [bacterium]
MKSRTFVLGTIILVIMIGFAVSDPIGGRDKETGDLTDLDSVKGFLHGKVEGILKKGCSISGCHRGSYPKAKLNLEPEKWLEEMKDVPSRQKQEIALIDTTDPEKSYLLWKIRGDEGIAGKRMPIQAAPLTGEEITTLRLYIHVLHVLESGK